MSTGGAFTLIVNDTALDDLMKRESELVSLIQQIEAARSKKAMMEAKAQGRVYDPEEEEESYVPTLVEINKYYTVPIFKFFKPFIAASMEYMKHIPATSGLTFGGTVSWIFRTGNCMFVTDAVIHYQLSSFSATSALDKVRYCAFPGHRMCQHTRFKIGGNPIDDYFADDYNRYLAWQVPARKWPSWYRNVGQQWPYQGLLVGEPSVDEYGELRFFVEGPQTFKNTQPQQDWFVPLLLWFCDPGFALPNGIIPWGQTTVEVELPPVSEMISYADFGGGGAFTPPKIVTAELWVNMISVVDELQDIFSTRYGYSIIRVHRHFQKVVNQPKGRTLLSTLRWPIERIYFGYRPRENLDNSQSWYLMSVLTQVNIPEVIVSSLPLPNTIKINYAQYNRQTPSVTHLALDAHGIYLFHQNLSQFFNSYTTFQAGNDELNGPLDSGWFLMNFNIRSLANGEPSGHINVSKARELYLTHESTYIGTNTPVDLLVSADAINFLGVELGNAALKYST